MHLFGKNGTKSQRTMWEGTYQIYWVPLLKSRRELRAYVAYFWPHFDIPSEEDEQRHGRPLTPARVRRLRQKRKSQEIPMPSSSLPYRVR
jgi:hypothetical protein